jgi:hypothetical protein
MKFQKKMYILDEGIIEEDAKKEVEIWSAWKILIYFNVRYLFSTKIIMGLIYINE